MSNTFPIEFPNLNAAESAALNQALALKGAGASVTLHVTYKKVTKTKARKPGSDFVKLAGVAGNVILGDVCKITTGAKGTVILVDSLTRASADPTKRGWTNLRPEGILSATVVRISLPTFHKPTAPKPEPKVEPVENKMLSDEEIAEESKDWFRIE